VLLRLIPGIKRTRFRANDPRSGKADAEFAAKRPNVLARHKLTCQGCGYVSKVARALDVHHLDDNHHNNGDDNLVPACHLCHPYQHVGELARRSVDVVGEGLGELTRIASVPEIGARDLNLLMRAIGAALLDDAEKPIAKRILKVLMDRSEWTQAEFGSSLPRDLSAAMNALSDAEYAAREDAMADQRVVFGVAHLKRVGQQLAQDYPSMPLKSWQGVHDSTLAKGKAKANTAVAA
jgi:intracellular multiplication protein IcmJ